MYRLTSLARAALRERGIADIRAHIVLVRQKTSAKSVGTILVSPEPFSEKDLAALQEVVATLRFDLVLAPGSAGDPAFVAIASGLAPAPGADGPPLRVDAPTDDAPFFFNMLRLQDALSPRFAGQGSIVGNQRAVVMLGALLIGVVVLTLACLLAPLGLLARDPSLRGGAPYLLFFTCIGLGFMLVEISQMQRLIIFLGHPTYGLSVVLFALLLAGGAGSFSTRSLGAGRAGGSGKRRLAVLVIALSVFGVLAPRLVGACASAPTLARILVAVGLLLPIGFLMGSAFPIGMSAAVHRYSRLAPWFWGVNGAASVCASVLATAISLSWGISVSFWTGVACYALALGAFVRAIGTRPGRRSDTS
jgi:hypothetical protein